MTEGRQSAMFVKVCTLLSVSIFLYCLYRGVSFSNVCTAYTAQHLFVSVFLLLADNIVASSACIPSLDVFRAHRQVCKIFCMNNIVSCQNIQFYVQYPILAKYFVCIISYLFGHTTAYNFHICAVRMTTVLDIHKQFERVF